MDSLISKAFDRLSDRTSDAWSNVHVLEPVQSLDQGMQRKAKQAEKRSVQIVREYFSACFNAAMRPSARL
jgi:hypothetical protein